MSRWDAVRKLFRAQAVWIGVFLLASGIALGADILFEGSSPAEPEAPLVGPSLARVLGALVLVIGIFLGAVWVVRNWRRFAPRSSVSADLRVLEVRSLGVRQSLVVVGYRKQRMLLAATSSGITLLSHLPEGNSEVSGTSAETVPWAEPPAAVDSNPSDFVGAFREVLARRV